VTSELHQQSDLTQDSALLRRSCDCYPATSAELDETFISENVHGPKDRVLVHSENGGDVFGQRQAITGSGLSFGDGATDLGCDLIVEQNRV
jgi:hypothetical protein